MKRGIAVSVLLALMLTLSTTLVFADVTATVKGVCKDTQGKPIVGATVRWVEKDKGIKYELKTNDKGEYFSLGIALGTYTATLFVDGKEIYHFTNVPVQSNEQVVDFDLKKELQNTAQGQGLSKEQIQQQQEAQAKQSKDANSVKVLNEKLKAAGADIQAGNFDQAIAAMNEANQIDPNRDAVWYTLAEATKGSALKQSDPAQKKKLLEDTAADYQKAIDLKKQAEAAAKKPDPQANQKIAGYYNNMGDAFAKAGKTDDAVKAYAQAAELDPSNAGKYYFNEGATMTNANVANDAKMRQAASEAFDKSIAADPSRADAYYWKGTNLIGMATLKGDKIDAPPGTADAFKKYLELQPTGPHADEAKAMLASLSGSVETTYGKKKTKK